MLLLGAILAAAGLTIPLDSSPAAQTVRLSVDGAPPWPAAATLHLRNTDSGQELTRTLTATEAAQLTAVTLTPGRYQIEMTAAHHRPAYGQVVVPRGASVTFGELRLAAAAVARGVVHQPDGMPAAGATIRAEHGELGSTNARGEFAVEIPDPRPAALFIAARAFGTKVVPLPGGNVDAAVPPLTLSPAASVTLTIGRDEPRDIDLLLQRWEDLGTRIDVARRRVAARTPSVTFDDLDAGTWVVIVRGSRPLEVLGAKVNVGTGDRSHVTITIHPVTAEIRASFAGKPLPQTTLSIGNVAFHWREDVKTDAEGRFTAGIWQPGAVVVRASGGALKAPFTETAELHGGRLDFIVPDRQVRGRVIDGGSGRGVPGLLVVLHAHRGEVRTAARTETDANGAFVFNAVAPGEYRLNVRPFAYLIPAPVAFTANEGDPPHDFDVTLDAGAPRSIRLFLHDGRPAAGAEIDAVAGGEVRAVTTTDANGNATVPLPRDGDATLIAIPREGSFIMLRARDAERITLPPPSSSLRIVTRLTDGTPMPAMELLMSFNGMLIPPEVAWHMNQMQGLTLQTDTHGEVLLRNIPPGWYQFWPYRNDAEAQAILASTPVEAPIALNVRTGENAAAVDFQRTE